MHVLEPEEAEVGENLASQPSRADDEDLALVPEEVFRLSRLGGVSGASFTLGGARTATDRVSRSEVGRKGRRAAENLVRVAPSP